MISAYETYVINAMTNYYNHNYKMFFEYLDEGVIWYGPREGQYIVGKENLVNSIVAQKRDTKFSVENIKSQLISCAANVHTVVLNYNLKAVYKNGSTRVYHQRVVVNGQKFRDHDGKIFWRCPFIQVSNIMPSTDKDRFSLYVGENTVAVNGEKSDTSRIVFNSENHSKVYIIADSIKYVVGGKGVLSYIHTDDNVYLVRHLLKDVVEKLPGHFYRCHSSYIVNLKKVLYLSSHIITLSDKTEIPVSSKRHSEIKDDISRFMLHNNG